LNQKSSSEGFLLGGLTVAHGGRVISLKKTRYRRLPLGKGDERSCIFRNGTDNNIGRQSSTLTKVKTGLTKIETISQGSGRVVTGIAPWNVTKVLHRGCLVKQGRVNFNNWTEQETTVGNGVARHRPVKAFCPRERESGRGGRPLQRVEGRFNHRWGRGSMASFIRKKKKRFTKNPSPIGLGGHDRNANSRNERKSNNSKGVSREIFR